MSYTPNCDVAVIPNFKRELKKLAKKYPSLKGEFATLIASLEVKPEQGTALGKSCYKIRLAISSKGKGKSGGSRVVTYVKVSRKTVYLLFHSLTKTAALPHILFEHLHELVILRITSKLKI
ncbi:MAG: hypothetical protein GVX78_05365 [Bacteroidetes bacterium]|jgi:mRNA-degrading endonuclease RelE of RelBE toxin-antitoxin system|nr:hypothetical protein [Bacteroidota bacterium]